MDIDSHCWCGNRNLELFFQGYYLCRACETLVSHAARQRSSSSSATDRGIAYDREYWFSHQTEDLHLPEIIQRARFDLSERCLHWLRTTLEYKLPKARTLELGSGHGGFVALLRWAGFDSMGLEIDPWVVRFSEDTFHIPMLLGPIERQSLAKESLDIIFLMDVLEHLPEPLLTLNHCLRFLKPDGILILQTPCIPESNSYNDIFHNKPELLKILIPNEHLYLFSRSSIERLFHRLGIDYIQFAAAIFPHTDMFLVAGRNPLYRNSLEEIEKALSSSPSGRMIQALLDTYRKFQQLREGHDEEMILLRRQLHLCEADRAARLELIQKFDARLREIGFLEEKWAWAKSKAKTILAKRIFRLVSSIGPLKRFDLLLSILLLFLSLIRSLARKGFQTHEDLTMEKP